MQKLFGTDGIRGKANRPPMTGPTALAVGRAVARYFSRHAGCRRIVMGKDTRLSGDMLEHAIAAGVCAAGCDALLAGVVPTPAVACLVNQNERSAGIVISASHNPWYDNGIKVFGPDGRKLSEQVEAEIETLVSDAGEPPGQADTNGVGCVQAVPGAAGAYVDFLCGGSPGPDLLNGLKVVIDCAHGAACAVAPEVFKRLGADLTVLNAAPDGQNINADCGSEHTTGLEEAVNRTRADIGLAFDGDADRLIAVDEHGRVVAGDQLIAICAAHYKETDRLTNNCVVTTVMSNIGLKRALERLGITHTVSAVGDRHVMEKMASTGAVVGGENSGHMIFSDRHTTGDGILSALKILEVMQVRATPLSELKTIMDVFPQELLAVDVQQKPNLDTLPEVAGVIADIESRLGDEGRVLVRYSGTQPVCRVMVEGPDEGVTAAYCREIAAVVQKCIGV